MSIKSYKDLDVWKKGIEIVDLVYEITCEFPKEERFNLASHMQRTAVSIPSNIAEGYMRQYTKEYIQFAYVAQGSCAELETQTIVAKNRNYIDDENFQLLTGALDHEGKMLTNLVKKLRGHMNHEPQSPKPEAQIWNIL